ncbi:MAG: aminotransferase class V-fold PLP-dependent enzyme [Spirochaetaceae bacterium]|nr:MAG: aminotransferase class V-fold PLP-dependent enzyme [Spirochaetaceae bacterium]
MSTGSLSAKATSLQSIIRQELENKIYLALQRYANVHRGAGQHAQISTRLYDKAREVVLDYLGLEGREYCAIFGTRRMLSRLNRSILSTESVYRVFSNDLGLPLGIGALAFRKSSLPVGVPDQRGGGTVNLVSRNHVIWKNAPERFEAGTPNIIGVVILAAALQLIRRYGDIDVFRQKDAPSSARSILYTGETDGETGLELLEKLRLSAIGRGSAVPTSAGFLPFVNFDSAASTPTFLSVWNTVRRTLRQPQVPLQEISIEVENLCAEFFQAPLDEYEVLFISNSTEGINIVAESLRHSGDTKNRNRTTVLISEMEHNSNELSWRYAPGISLLRLPVDHEGFICLRKLEETLSAYNREGRFGGRRIRLVAVSGCSNVVGAMNDLEKISVVVHRYGASLLIDAAQLAAHRRIDMQEAGIDILVCSGHKMYAPFGAGLLIVRKGLLNISAGELNSLRSTGLENAVGIAALGKAMDLLSRVGIETIRAREKELTRRAIEGLHGIPSVQIYGVSDILSDRFESRGPVLAFRLKNVHHNLAAKMLAEIGGIGVRSGCFCAHLFVKQLMGISSLQSFGSNVTMLLSPHRIEQALPGIVRASFSFLNTEDEIDHFLRILGQIAAAPMPFLNRLFARSYYGTPRLPVTVEQQRIEEMIAKVETEIYGAH